MSIKKEPDSDSSLELTDDEDIPSLPPHLAPLNKTKCLAVQRKSKSIEDRVQEQIKLAKTFKVENVAQDHMEERLKLMTIANQSYEDPEPDPVATTEEEIKIFCVNDSLQFFNVKDVTPVFCGYNDNSHLLTRFEKDMLGFIRVELQNILPSFLLTCHPNCISDCKSFVSFLLHNLSISNEAASVVECYHCIIKILDGHPFAEHIVFDSIEVFSVLFNYGIDVENCQLFKWKPGLKDCLSKPAFQSKSFNKIPDNWTYNFEFILKSLTKVISICIVKGEDLSNMLLFFLWTSFDSRIHSEDLYHILEECIAACIDRILEEMLIDVAAGLVKMEIFDEKDKWDVLYKFVESIPNTTQKCCLLKKQIGFLALGHICSTKKEDNSTNVQCTFAELKLLICQLTGIKSETLLLSAAKFIDLCTCDVNSDIEECDRLCNHLKRIENSLPETAHLAKSNLCKTHSRLKRNALKSSMYALPAFQRRPVYSPIKIEQEIDPYPKVNISKREIDIYPQVNKLKRELDLYPEINKPISRSGEKQAKMSDYFLLSSPKCTGNKVSVKNTLTKTQLFSDPAVTHIKCEPDVESNSAASSCGVVVSSITSCADPSFAGKQEVLVPVTSYMLQSCEPKQETIIPDLPKISTVSSVVHVKSEPYSAVTEPTAGHSNLRSKSSSAISQPCAIESTYSSAVSQPCLKETTYSFEIQDIHIPTPKIVSVESQAVDDYSYSASAVEWGDQTSTSNSNFLPFLDTHYEKSKTSDSTFLTFPQDHNVLSRTSNSTFPQPPLKQPETLNLNSHPPNRGQKKLLPVVEDSIRHLFTSSSNPASSSDGNSGFNKSGLRKTGNSSKMCVDSFVKQVLIDIENPDIMESSNSASFDAFPLLTTAKNVPSGRCSKEDEIMIVEEVQAAERRDKSHKTSVSNVLRHSDKGKQNVIGSKKDVFSKHDKRERVATFSRSHESSISMSQTRSELEVTVVSPSSASKLDKRPSVMTQAIASMQRHHSSHSKTVTEDEITILREVKSPAKKKISKTTSKDKSAPVMPPSSLSVKDATNKFKDIFPFCKDLVVKEIPAASSPAKALPEKAPEIEALSKRLGLSITSIKNTNEPEDGDEIVVVKEVQPLNVKKPLLKKKQKPKDDNSDIFFMRQSMGHKVEPDPPIVVDFQIVLTLNSVLSKVDKLCWTESGNEDVTSIVLPRNIPGLECVPLNEASSSYDETPCSLVEFTESDLISEDSLDRFISSGAVLESVIRNVSLEAYLVDGDSTYAETIVAAESALESAIQEVVFDDMLAGPVENVFSRQADVNMVVGNLAQEVSLKSFLLCSAEESMEPPVPSCQLDTEINANLQHDVSMLISSIVQDMHEPASRSNAVVSESGTVVAEVFDNLQQDSNLNCTSNFNSLASACLKNEEVPSVSELPMKNPVHAISKTASITMSLSDSMEKSDGIKCNLLSDVTRSSAVDAIIKDLIREVRLRSYQGDMFSLTSGSSKSDNVMLGSSLDPNFSLRIPCEPGLFTARLQNQRDIISMNSFSELSNSVSITSACKNDNLPADNSVINPMKGVIKMCIVTKDSDQKSIDDHPVKEITCSAHVFDNLLDLEAQKNEEHVLNKDIRESLETLLESVVSMSKLSALRGTDVIFRVPDTESSLVESSKYALNSEEVNKENSLHITPNVSWSLQKFSRKKRFLKAKCSETKATSSPTILRLKKMQSPKKASCAAPLNSRNKCNKELPTIQMSPQKKHFTDRLTSETPCQEDSNELYEHVNRDVDEDSSKLISPRSSVKRKSPDLQNSVHKVSRLSSPSKTNAEIGTQSKYKPYPSKLYHSPKKSNFFARSILFSTKKKSPYKSSAKLSPKKPHVVRKYVKNSAILSETGLVLPHLLRQKLLPTSSRLNLSDASKEISLCSSSDSDVEILYEDPKYYADSDCIIVYEKDGVILLD